MKLSNRQCRHRICHAFGTRKLRRKQRRSYDRSRKNPHPGISRPANATRVQELFSFSGAVALDLILPLAVTGQLVSNLSFTFEAKTHVGLVAIYIFVVREIVQAVYFTVQDLICCRLCCKLQQRLLRLLPAELGPGGITVTFMLLTLCYMPLFAFLCHCILINPH